MKTGDDQPFIEEKVEVHLMKSIETFYKQSFQTDQNGYLEFTYDPTSCSSECQRGSLTESPETIAIKVTLTLYILQFKTLKLTKIILNYLSWSNSKTLEPERQAKATIFGHFRA